ncbi:pyridoxamine 5'-phosphate oxidase family protein [Streptomyces roseoviridis]|uniref:Pyridoxamine 5'-phosphate oxidase family protein n=1 Tax=Streptomyces roseoviridis TaxID=67361 RepID=A0ABV5QN06_9ACTN
MPTDTPRSTPAGSPVSTPANTTLDSRYSGPGAEATPWAEAVRRLAAAEVYWLTTVRPDGRPHVTPLIAVWREGALHFCTRPDERKARNLAANRRVALTTGTNALGEGFDLVIEGEAVRVTDEEVLRALAEAYADKYGEEWRFGVRDGGFVSEGGTALVFAVPPTTAFGFAKGTPYGQTRWRFTEES